MRFATVCSGIEAPSVAWSPLGWRAQWFSEIAPFPSRLLAERYPDVPNLGDMNDIKAKPGSIDLLAGGTPCQSFSLAGLRGGMADARGNLALVFLRLTAAARPRWVVWENVPGVLSADRGGAFGSILGGLAELGYGWAYRVLDAQYFGVPQQRLRVFVVGCLGDWRGAAAVLFERSSMRGDSPPSRGAREKPAGALTASAGKRGASGLAPEHLVSIQSAQRSRGRRQNGMGIRGDGAPMFTLDTRGDHAICFDTNQITSPENRSRPEPGRQSPTLAARGAPPAIAFHPTQDPVSGEVSPALGTTTQGMGVAHTLTAHHGRNDGEGNYIAEPYRVRRLTPLECERLQGFPDGYTAIPKASNSARYAALGNSIAVPKLRWIGERIAAVEAA